jgi:hypothetical protein
MPIVEVFLGTRDISATLNERLERNLLVPSVSP